MRVALISHTARPSGAELAMWDLAVALHEREDIDVELIFLEDGPIVRWAKDHCLPVSVLPLNERAGSLRRSATWRDGLGSAQSFVACAGRLADLLTQRQIDIAHTNSLKAHLVGALARRGTTKLIWQLRDILAAPHVPRSVAFALRTTSRRADRVIAISEACAAALPRRVSDVVPSCVRLDRFMAIRELSSVAPERPVLTLVGRLAPWKGQIVAIEALRRLAVSGIRARLVIAGGDHFGDANYVDELRGRATGIDCEFRGHVENVEDLYAKSHFVLHTSTLPEPLGKVVVEGLAAGRVVIAAGAGGPPEILTGKHRSWLVEPGSASALADAIERALASWPSTVRLAREGRGLCDRFDVATVAERTMQVYRATVQS